MTPISAINLDEARAARARLRSAGIGTDPDVIRAISRLRSEAAELERDALRVGGITRAALRAHVQRLRAVIKEICP